MLVANGTLHASILPYSRLESVKSSAAVRHRVPFAFRETLRPPVDDLCGSGLDRCFPPPGDDEQPDDPHKETDLPDEIWDRLGGREALGSEQPAIHEEGQARQPHKVTDRPGD